MSEATSAVTPTQQQQSYPSPTHAARLPFYQDRNHDGRSSAAREEEHRLSRTTPGSNGGLHEARREVPDDPQMRATLEQMMRGSDSSFGSLGSFGALLSHSIEDHETAQASGVPHGSIAYAHANGSPDAAAPMHSRDKPRSKVSRACDECRRKKIRCDALDETGNTPCTSCARSGLKCAFSRQPMKRGPSKGYIKELAERLHTLEQQVHEPAMAGQHQQEIQQVQQAIAESVQQGFASTQGLAQSMLRPQSRPGAQDSGAGDAGRSAQQAVVLEPRLGEKRSHAVSEGMYSGQQPVWNANHRPTPAPPQSQAQYAAQNHPGYQQAPYALSQPPTPHYNHQQPFWRQGPNDRRHETTNLPYEAETQLASTSITSFDWDESVIDEYHRIIHQTFPLLPNNKNRLRQRLAECPASLREAFLAALDCLMRTFPTTTLPPNAGYAQALKRAAELLAKYPFDNPSTHTSSTNLVYLQTLIIMALESDNHGPATIRGQAGPSRAEWLGRAAGVAGQIQINTIRTQNQSVMEGDRDSEDRLARRVWWVLFILDRWHASSTADLLKLPENSVILLPEDQILLGESTYHLARLSFIIGHLASILTTTKTPSTDVMAPSNPASSLLGLTLAGEIDRFRESVEGVWGSLNLVHLSYHHCHLLIKRLNPTTEPVELIEHAVKVATVLNSRLTPVTPLNHHFGALAAMTLCELCDVPRTRAEALRGLEQMVECLGKGRGLAGKLESEGWDGAVRELVVRKKERMLAQGGATGADGLQGLADAAVGNSAPGAGGPSEKFDPTMLTRYGYLTALGQGIFRTK